VCAKVAAKSTRSLNSTGKIFDVLGKNVSIRKESEHSVDLLGG